MTEDFTYDSPVGGRMSGKSTQIANSPASGVAESWTYTSLGLIGTHNYPRRTGSLAVSSAYDAGLPVAITAGGQSARRVLHGGQRPAYHDRSGSLVVAPARADLHDAFGLRHRGVHL